MGRRAATVDVRDALAAMSVGLSEASARQFVGRMEFFLGYAHQLGYTPFNGGSPSSCGPMGSIGAAVAAVAARPKADLPSCSTLNSTASKLQ